MTSSETGAIIATIAFWCIVGGLVGAVIGSFKGRAGAGFWWGFFLGIIGWIIAAFMAPRDRYAVAGAVNANSTATYQQQLKQWAVGEAIRRDPSLGASSDSATLARLERTAQQIMSEAEVLRMQQQAMNRPPQQ